MKKKILLGIICLSVFLLCSCGGEGSEETDYSSWKGEMIGSYLAEDGYYFTVEDDQSGGKLLYYYDIESEITVPLCDKAECGHQAVDLGNGEEPQCNAQIEEECFLEYHDRIYYITFSDMKMVLRARDKDGNNDEKVAVLDAAYLGDRAWAYCDVFFVTGSTSVSGSFQADTHESDDSVLKLFAVDLKTGKVDEVSESPLTESVMAFEIYRFEEENVYMYDLFRQEWQVYNLKTKELSEQENIPDTLKHITVSSGSKDEVVYTHFAENAGYGFKWSTNEVVHLDLETGTEKVLYTGEYDSESLTYNLFGTNGLLILDCDTNDILARKLYYYNESEDELYEVGGDFYKNNKWIFPSIGNDEGCIYLYPVNADEETTSYSGDFEIRYMSLDDYLGGKETYKLVYYLKQ